MSSYSEIREKDTVETADEQDAVRTERPEQRATVRLETQAKIDSEAIEKVAESGPEHPYGMTLVAEEKWESREREKARTHERRRTQSTVREQGSRMSVSHGRKQARRRFDERAASVDPWQHPERGDPQAELEREQLAAVNQQAERITNDVRETASRAAVSRRLGKRVASGDSVLSASVAVMEAERTRPGTVVPIGSLEGLSRKEVDIQGEIVTLWTPKHPAIAQVGLIEDESGTTKFTSWKKSRAPMVSEGDYVRMRAVAKSWYAGRVSVALTGESRVVKL